MIKEMQNKVGAVEVIAMPVVEYDEPVPDYADVMGAKTFRDDCENNCFTDYDGHGHPVKGGMMASKVLIKPSGLSALLDDCTHVAWFNR